MTHAHTCNKLLRYGDLVQRGVVRNRTTLARWQDRNQFPKPIKIGPNTVAWRESDVEQWLDTRSSDSNDAGVTG
jgi:prophage regulatory protein